METTTNNTQDTNGGFKLTEGQWNRKGAGALVFTLKMLEFVQSNLQTGAALIRARSESVADGAEGSFSELVSLLAEINGISAESALVDKLLVIAREYADSSERFSLSSLLPPTDIDPPSFTRVSGARVLEIARNRINEYAQMYCKYVTFSQELASSFLDGRDFVPQNGSVETPGTVLSTCAPALS